MNHQQIEARCAELFSEVPGNVLRPTDKIRSKYVGTQMFDAPLVGFGSAADPLFEKYKDPAVIGPWHMSPEEWLPGAKSIVSLFFPMSEAVLESNRAQKKNPPSSGSTPALRGRISSTPIPGPCATGSALRAGMPAARPLIRAFSASPPERASRAIRR